MKRLNYYTPFDFNNAPYSGWTRSHWEESFFGLMKGIMGSASPGFARQRIPGPRSHHGQLADELEGFTRSFIMAGPWLNTSKTGSFELEGQVYDIAEFYRKGILNGTDPEHEEYWGDITDYAQHLVEMASLAWSLFLSKNHIWDKFNSNQQKQVADYLYKCTKVKYHKNNWLLFNVVTNAVLKKLGMPYSQKQIDENLGFCDSMYIGDGWYRDGDVNRIDYYNSWGFLYYYLIWVILDGDSKPEYAEIHKERVREFAQSFRYFISGDGSTPCFGRSMIYRFGYFAPIVLAQSMGILDIDPGEVRTMCSLGTKYFLDKEIITGSGHLGLGYLTPCSDMLEHYSCGGSPYWAVKAFNIFLIPKDNPFWSGKEKPLPIHKENYSVPIKSAGFLILGDKRTGHVQLINQKSRHDKAEYNDKYTNLSYSSIFSYDARKIYGNVNCDASLQFSKDGINYKQRWKINPLHCEKNFVASSYTLFDTDEDGEVRSYIIVKDDCLISIHRIDTKKELSFRQGPYSLGYDNGTLRVESKEGAEAAYAEGKLTFIQNLYGWSGQLAAEPNGSDVNGSNVKYRQSVLPVLKHECRKNSDPFILASISCSRIGSDSIDQLMSLVTEFTVGNETVSMKFYDGERVILQTDEEEVEFVIQRG